MRARCGGRTLRCDSFGRGDLLVFWESGVMTDGAVGHLLCYLSFLLVLGTCREGMATLVTPPVGRSLKMIHPDVLRSPGSGNLLPGPFDRLSVRFSVDLQAVVSSVLAIKSGDTA